MKLTPHHNIWERWCGWAAESVYVDHRPTKEEIEEVCKKNWNGIDPWSPKFDLCVFKLKPFYTNKQ